MRKYLYQVTMRIFPVYFTAIIIAVVIFAVFFTAPKAHAQANHVDFNSMLSSVHLNSFKIVETSTDEERIIVLEDESKPKVEIFSAPEKQFIEINANREVEAVFIYDDHNSMVEDMPIDYLAGKVDVSGLCPGVYYIRVDYCGGSYLKRFVH